MTSKAAGSVVDSGHFMRTRVSLIESSALWGLSFGLTFSGVGLGPASAVGPLV